MDVVHPEHGPDHDQPQGSAKRANLHPRLRRRIRSAVCRSDGDKPVDGRLADDARRLWNRHRVLSRQLQAAGELEELPAADSGELACWALQLPLRTVEPAPLPVGPLGVVGIRERAERAAQRLVEELGEVVPTALLDETTRLMQEMPQRPPVLEAAKVLSDIFNLDDFGVVGVLRDTAEQALRDRGVTALSRGFAKRQDYKYWQVRLKDGFHYPLVRRIARRRLDHARRLFETLDEELGEDMPT